MLYFSQTWRRARRLRRRTRLAVAGLALAGLAATLVAGGPVANAHPGQPSAVFDPGQVGWAGIRNRTVAQFDQDLADWKRRGHVVVDIEVDTFDGEPSLGAAFQTNVDGRDWQVETMMTKAQYDAYFDQMKKAGYRLVDREMYVHRGVWNFSAAFVENVEKLSWHARYGLTLAELDEYAREQRKDRRMPIDFDMYRTSEGIRYGLVTLANVENRDWHLHGDLTDAQFSATFDAYDADGFRMLSFDSAPSTQQLYGGIFVDDDGRGWRMRREMTAHQYGNWWHRYADEGLRQIFVGRYETADGVLSAQIWRQNRPTWSSRPEVDRIIEQEMAEDGVPGVAVAVMKDGDFVYTRGFGKADIAGDEWMDSGHVMRWASVSKALGGALAMRLHERGELDRDQAIRNYAPDVPNRFTATFEQMLGNRGCVRHYATDPKSSLKNVDADQYEAEKDADAEIASTWYADASTAAPLYYGDPLRRFSGGAVSTTCTPGQSYLYSTQSLAFAGRGFEAATGTGVKELVQQEIAGPLGLTTLRAEEAADTSVRRAKIYAGEDNVEVDRDQITGKFLGGGVESSVRDMARFGTAVLEGDVYADVDHVWDGTDHGWSYAYGWGVGTRDGHRYASKSGGQRGSDAHLLLFPDDGISIAVLINREELADADDHGTAIAWAVGDLMI
ncbi:serine hydrolase [Phytohabitans suffuscus]